MKTAITVLQEMMIKFSQTPEYECVAQTGPQHLAMFQYRCRARGAEVLAAARSKKEAKQEAARLMLCALAARGDPVPPPYARAPGASGAPPADGAEGGGAAGAAAAGAHSYVALLKDLCEEYRLAGAEYELVGDTGPPHLRQFTVRAVLAGHARLATASTKKAARQMAAQQLYTYLRQNLARLTKDFVEEDALVRAHERAMQRYQEAREQGAWRPDLGQPLSLYHRCLFIHVEEGQRESALRALEEVQWCEGGAGEGAGAGEEQAELLQRAVQAAATALGLTVRRGALPADSGALEVLELTPSLPEVALAGRSAAQAYASAARYMRLALTSPRPPAAAAPTSAPQPEPTPQQQCS